MKNFIFAMFNYFKEKEGKYLLINTLSNRKIAHTGLDETIYEALQYETKKQVQDYLKNDVAKNERRFWRIYKLDSDL